MKKLHESKQKRKRQHIPKQEEITLTPQQLTETIKHTLGVDNIKNLWYKQFT